ncbi:WD40 repeat domain-containing protein [Tahibacter sp.]|uniref:WD40 repeat domain-containing protein n=1 Tax=Tahibacter sp. TaxID=2056211 RepID=UPI0028C4D1F1|nr:WD40 repeat domain-containing protein [Tahibacter sp.]
MSESSPDVSPQRPWLGLRSYTTATQAYFYGRDRQIRELYERVQLNPLTVLYGRSGLGKTSLLQAGLVPRLTVEGRRAVMVRLNIAQDAPPLIDQVRAALAAQAAIEAGSRTLWELAHEAAARELVELVRPVLVLDQFEEIFTLDRRKSEKDRRHELAAFMAELAAFVENRPPAELAGSARSAGFDPRESALRVVIALREDYLHELERWKKPLPSLMRNRMELLELDGPSALHAVVGPGTKHTPALVDVIVAADIVRFVARRDGDTDLADIEAVPPLLSLLCAELNESRIRDEEAMITRDRVSLQGHDILQRFYERCFDGMPAQARDVVEDLLVDSGGRYRESSTRDTVVSELEQQGVVDASGVLDTLIERRLLTAEQRDSTQRIELTHDLLVPLAAASRALADRRREQAAAQLRADEERRNRLSRLKGYVATVTALLLVFACAAALYAYLEGRKASNAHAEAQSAKAKVEQTLTEAAQRAFGRYQERIDDTSDPARYAYLAESLGYREPDDARAAALIALQQMDARIPGTQFAAATTEPVDAAFSADGSLLLSHSTHGPAILWEVTTGRKIREMEAHAFRGQIQLSADGTRLAHVDMKGGIHVANLSAPDRDAATLSYDPPATAVAFSADGTSLLAVSNSSVRVWNLRDGTSKPMAIPARSEIRTAQFSNDASHVLTVDAGGNVTLFEASSGNIVAGLATDSAIESASLSPDQNHVIVTEAEGGVSLWAMTPKKRAWQIKVPWLRSAGFSPDGSRVAIEHVTGRVDLYNTMAGREFAMTTARVPRTLTFPDHDRAGRTYVIHPAFSPDGLLVAGILDGKPSLRLTEQGTTLSTFSEGSNAIYFRFLPHGTHVLGIDSNGLMSIVDIRTRAPQCDVSRYDQVIDAIDELEDGSLSLRSADTIHRSNATRNEWIKWHAGAAEAAFQLDEESKPVPLGTLLANRRHREFGALVAYGGLATARLALATSANEVRLYDAVSGQPIGKPIRFDGPVADIRLNQNGKRLLVTRLDVPRKRIVFDLWQINVETSSLQILSSEMDSGSSTVLAVDSAAGRFATYDEAKNVRVWSFDAFGDQPDMTTELGPIETIAFSRDGTRVAALTLTDELVVMRIRDATVLFRRDVVSSSSRLAFSPEGRRLVVATQAYTSVFDADTGDPVFSALPGATKTAPLAFSKNGTLAALSRDEDGISIVSMETGATLSSRLPTNARVRAVHFARDRRSIMIALDDATVRTCNLRTDTPVTPAQLQDALQQLGGRLVGSDGRIRPAERKDLLSMFRKRGPQTQYEHLLRWHYGEEPRTTRPFSRVLMRSHLDEEIARLMSPDFRGSNREEQLFALYLIDPTHPEILNALSLYTQRSELIKRFSALTAQRRKQITHTSGPGFTPAAAASAPAAHPPATVR